MKSITIAGRIGGDATVRNTDSSDVVSFNVAVDDGFGDKKTTLWFSCSMWGKRGVSVAPHLRKGTAVTVSGDLSTREHEGKTYLQIRANDLTLQGGKSDGDSRPSNGASSYDDRGNTGGAASSRDLDGDDIPFAPEWRG